MKVFIKYAAYAALLLLLIAAAAKFFGDRHLIWLAPYRPDSPLPCFDFISAKKGLLH